MKCIVIAYINSNELITDIENIMGYYKFSIIESNNNYRVFTGHFKGSAGKLTAKLNAELENAEFSIDDSLFIAYPVMLPEGHATISNIIIKRKGNKYLRKNFFF